MSATQTKLEFEIEDLKFTSTHEWLLVEDKTVVIGVTEFVTNALGPAVGLDLPLLEDEVLTIVPFGELEAVEDTFDINSPVEGEVIDVNEFLMNKLEILSADPYKKGWLIKIAVEDMTAINSLMSKAEYEKKFHIELNGKKKSKTDVPVKKTPTKAPTIKASPAKVKEKTDGKAKVDPKKKTAKPKKH